MITPLEAAALVFIRDNPLIIKRELLVMLSGTYDLDIDMSKVSSLVDQLEDAGLLTSTSSLPRSYAVVPANVYLALKEFDKFVSDYSLCCQKSKALRKL